MTRLTAALVALLLAACGTAPDARPPPDPAVARLERTVDRLRAENTRLDTELVRSNADQQDLHRRLDDLQRRLDTATRASRGTPRSTTTVRRASTGGCSGWAHLVGRYAWPTTIACAVLACESRGNPAARNRRSSATGLFQILGGPTDPGANVARAYAMWRTRGWQPWNASRSCWS